MTARAPSLLAGALALVALLPHGRAALPGLTYYFRDFTVTFYPLRRLWATELAAGRFPTWNPYVNEGAFLLPSLYPMDLLHALFPGPAAVSWLLTLHFPLAALAAYALARDLGCDRPGAFVAGVVHSTCGLAVSSLNLFVFLQALAWAPLVALGLRRAMALGGRWTAAGGALVAVALSTLAVEFVAQAVALGIALGLAALPRARAAARGAFALAIAAGLAAVPLAMTLDALAGSVRGAGFPREVALGNEVHPAALLQVLLPGVFGSLSAPVEDFWGARFHSKGFPYFLSLYLGPCALALAAAGWRRVPRPTAGVVGALGALGLWYALGERAGLAGVVASIPAAQWFRFPSKAMLLPSLAAALLAGFGADRLRAGEGWRTFGIVIAAAAVVALAVAALPFAAPDLPARVLALGREAGRHAGRRAAADAAVVLAVCVLAGAAVLAVHLRRLAPAPAAAAVTVLLAADLARAAAGMNPQVTPAFFAPLPEMRALSLDRLDGGRVFSYGLDASPAFRRFAAARPPGLGLWSFFLSRQALAPYANMLDRVELAEGKDLTSFVPRPPEILADEYDPARAAEVVPRLQSAAVTRVVALDPVEHPALRPLASVPAGPPGVDLRVYEVAGAWPRRYVACGVVTATGGGSAAPAAGFDPGRDVVLEGPAPVDLSCTRGTVTVVSSFPGDETYDVEADGPGMIVLRDSFAPRWTAEVDGSPVPVVRANGKNRAAPVPAGRHRVRFRYLPRGLDFAPWLTAAALAAAVVAAIRRPRGPARPPEV